MFINTPPITLSCTRTGANAFPNEHLFVIPSVHQAAGSPAVQPGDFCVIADLANSANGTLPTPVTPSGFTHIAGSNGSQQNGNASKGHLSAKILTAADIGATRTGLNGSDNGRKMVATFQMSRPVSFFSAFGFSDGAGPIGGDPPLLTSVPSNPIAGTLLFVGMGCGESGFTPTGVNVFGSIPYNISGTDDTGTVVSATRVFYSMYPFGVTASNFQFNMPDASANNANWALTCGFILN